MKATELLEFLREFHRDKLTMRQRHQAAARHVTDYDFNNTYQYVIAREDMHVSWLRDAILDVSGQVGQAAAGLAEDAVEPVIRCRARAPQAQSAVMAQDRDGAQVFVDKWRPRVDALSHARHRTMLNVIIGETLEHKRFFEQAVSGPTDLLGRRADGAGTGEESCRRGGWDGAVVATRRRPGRRSRSAATSGDRQAAMTFALDRLSRILSDVSTSHLIETEPKADGEVLATEPLFLNAVVVGTPTLEARALLEELLAIERAFGRERPYPGAARTLDLDLILLGDDVDRRA